MKTENLAASWAEAKIRIQKVLPEVAGLMGEQFAQMQDNPRPGIALDQVGLRNGTEAVTDYIKQNEMGLTLEHLCCMVEEASLPISATVYSHMKVAEQIMQMSIPALKRITPPSK